MESPSYAKDYQSFAQKPINMKPHKRSRTGSVRGQEHVRMSAQHMDLDPMVLWAISNAVQMVPESFRGIKAPDERSLVTIREWTKFFLDYFEQVRSTGCERCRSKEIYGTDKLCNNCAEEVESQLDQEIESQVSNRRSRKPLNR